MSVPHKPASTDAKLHELIANRWSPSSFNSEHTLSDSQINILLEAARWAPSSMNAQPWRFLVGKRGDKNFSALLPTLRGNNTQWSPNSSAIILVAVTAENVSKIEMFDAGLAVSALCLQAISMGLHTRQVGGFSKSEVKKVFSLAENVEPVVLIMVGQVSDPANLNTVLKERELAPRSRKDLSELLLKGLE